IRLSENESAGGYEPYRQHDAPYLHLSSFVFLSARRGDSVRAPRRPRRRRDVVISDLRPARTYAQSTPPPVGPPLEERRFRLGTSLAAERLPRRTRQRRGTAAADRPAPRARRRRFGSCPRAQYGFGPASQRPKSKRMPARYSRPRLSKKFVRSGNGGSLSNKLSTLR